MIRLRQRLRGWWQARLPFTDTLALTQRNVYILPTAPGLMLAATLCVLLVASINYQLNLGYLLTFGLAGAALVGMHVGHGTLSGLRLSLAAPPPQFAGTAAVLTVTLASERTSPRQGIGLATQEDAQQRRWAWCDVPAQGRCTLQVGFRPERRGLHRVPPLIAETRFPLGTFRVWTVWKPAAQVLVYPAPEPLPPPLPAGEAQAGKSGTAAARASGEFDGVRPYRAGDPLRMVAWKKAAQADTLVSRDTQQAQRAQLWLDFAQAGSGGAEQRLSRLAAWVLQADRLAIDYGLRLPGRSIAPSHGEAHQRQCLEALALC